MSFEKMRSEAAKAGPGSQAEQVYIHECCHHVAYAQTIGDPNQDPYSGEVQARYRVLLDKHKADWNKP